MKEKPAKPPAPEQDYPGPPKTIIREYFESAVVTIIMALFGMTFVVQAVKVPTGSMQNTIYIGDQLLVNKFVFAPGKQLPFLPQREIKRGDIIVFKYPGNQFAPDHPFDKDPTNIPLKTNYVKRVIGLPGDMVEFRGTSVYVNGQLLPEQVLSGETNNPNNKPLSVAIQPPRKPEEKYSVYYEPETIAAAQKGKTIKHPDMHFGVDGPYKIPEGKYFVMGDSRDNSQDSRFWGVVPREYIFGRAMFVYWSYDESKPADNFPFSILTNSRWGRTGTMIK